MSGKKEMYYHLPIVFLYSQYPVAWIKQEKQNSMFLKQQHM